MAVYGVQATKIATGGIAYQCAEGTVDARVKCITDSYEASSLATSSTIYMGHTLPAGARILRVTLAYDAIPGTAETISVGDTASTSRYISARGITSAGAFTSELVDGLDYVIGTASGDNQIILTLTGSSAANGTIKLVVLYSKD